MGPCAANRATFLHPQLPSPPGDTVWPLSQPGPKLGVGRGFPSREARLLATELSSQIKGLFRLMCLPMAAGSWRNLSPGPRAPWKPQSLKGSPRPAQPQPQRVSNLPFRVGWGTEANPKEKEKVETPAPRSQREALWAGTPGPALRWPLRLRTACRGGKETGQLLGASETPFPPSPAQPVPRESKYLRSSHRLELEVRLWVGCLHVGTAQGKGA